MCDSTKSTRIGVYDWLLDYQDIDTHLKSIFAELSPNPVCVFGCGTSTLSELLLWTNRIIWSVDYDEAVINHMKTRNKSIELLKWDTLDLSVIPDESNAPTLDVGKFCSVIDKVFVVKEMILNIYDNTMNVNTVSYFVVRELLTP